MKASDFKQGDRVTYIPGVAYGDPKHEACEHGIVSSTNEVNVFVHYYKRGILQQTAQATSPEDLLKEL